MSYKNRKQRTGPTKKKFRLASMNFFLMVATILFYCKLCTLVFLALWVLGGEDPRAFPPLYLSLYGQGRSQGFPPLYLSLYGQGRSQGFPPLYLSLYGQGRSQGIPPPSPYQSQQEHEQRDYTVTLLLSHKFVSVPIPVLAFTHISTALQLTTTSTNQVVYISGVYAGTCTHFWQRSSCNCCLIS